LEAFERKQDFDHVKRNILYSNAKADKSYAGFLNNALKGDWEHDGFSSQNAYEKFMRKKQMMENGHENLIAAGY
jgi:hypothetical protein